MDIGTIIMIQQNTSPPSIQQHDLVELLFARISYFITMQKKKGGKRRLFSCFYRTREGAV